MAQSVDPNKVILKLAERIAHEVVQNVMNEVALEDASETIAQHEQQEIPSASSAG